MVPSLLGTVENLFAGCRKERPVCPSRARLAQSIRLVASASHALGRRHVKHSCPRLTTLRRVLTHRSTPPLHTQPGSRSHQLANRRSRNANQTSLRKCGRCAGPTADSISLRLAEQVVQVAEQKASFSVFGIVDALTRIAGRYENAGDRLVVDQKAASLLSLAA